MACAFMPRENREPWHLSRTPNYERARAVETIAAADVSPEDFHRNYVMRNRPALLVGAVTHWPAYSKWRSIAYLRRATKNIDVVVRTATQSEYVLIADSDIAEKLVQRNDAIFRPMTFHDFLEQVPAQGEQLVLHSIVMHPDQPLGELCADLGIFAFLPEPEDPVAYPPWRAFFYKNSYSDWHFHAFDEGLMTQVVGKKEVLLLPPDDCSWDALFLPACQTGYLYDVDPEVYPRVHDIHPYRVTVNDGDALFVPVYWWHAVASVDMQFGVTVARTFKTPLDIGRDERYPATRFLMRGKSSPSAESSATAVGDGEWG
jgi:hypothetical protein